MARLLHLHLEEVADSVLTLSVHQILTLGETAGRELGLLYGSSLGHHHLLPIKLQTAVLRWIYSGRNQRSTDT